MSDRQILEDAIAFIEGLAVVPLLMSDDIEMRLQDVQKHARIEAASLRKRMIAAAPAPSPSPAAKGGDAVRAPTAINPSAVCKSLGLEFEDGQLVKVNGSRPEYMGGDKLLSLVRVLAFAVNQSIPTEGPASQTEGVGGDAGARRKRASELMAPIMELSEDELILLRYSLPVETLARLRAALTPPETAEAVPVDLTAAYMAGVERGRDELRAERDEAVKALETAREERKAASEAMRHVGSHFPECAAEFDAIMDRNAARASREAHPATDGGDNG